MKTKVECPCGELIEGENEDDLVEKVKAHLADKHPGHDYTREQILSMAH